MPFSIIVDGPNLINDLKRNGKDKDYIRNILSFPIIANMIQRKLKENGLASHPYMGTEFICSNRGKIGDFKGQERVDLLNKLMKERGVTVKTVEQHVQTKDDNDERTKGDDMTVFVRLLQRGNPATLHHVVLVASDTDYVPALHVLREYGIHTILVAFERGKNPINMEMINQSYLFLDLEQLLTEMEEEIENTTVREESKDMSKEKVV